MKNQTRQNSYLSEMTIALISHSIFMFKTNRYLLLRLVWLTIVEV